MSHLFHILSILIFFFLSLNYYRFTNECIIISGATKVKPPCELQLASMSALTSKTSSQAFFLRTLKVIIQLRDAIRLSRTRRNGKLLCVIIVDSLVRLLLDVCICKFGVTYHKL